MQVESRHLNVISLGTKITCSIYTAVILEWNKETTKTGTFGLENRQSCVRDFG